MKIASGLGKLNGLLTTIGGWLQPVLLLGIRLYWGWQVAQTGWGKLMHIDKTAAFFTDLGLPFPKVNVILAGSTECFGGVLLLLGLGSRFITIPLMFTMGVAYATADKEALSAIFSDPDKFVSAAPFLFLLAALIVFVFGPGALSLDRLCGFDRRSGKAAA